MPHPHTLVTRAGEYMVMSGRLRRMAQREKTRAELEAEIQRELMLPPGAWTGPRSAQARLLIAEADAARAAWLAARRRQRLYGLVIVAAAVLVVVVLRLL